MRTDSSPDQRTKNDTKSSDCPSTAHYACFYTQVKNKQKNEKKTQKQKRGNNVVEKHSIHLKDNTCKEKIIITIGGKVFEFFFCLIWEVCLDVMGDLDFLGSLHERHGRAGGGPSGGVGSTL